MAKPKTYETGVRSNAHVAGHPVHPMLIPFPIAFLCGALVTDLVFWGTGDPFWARMSMWLITAGFATGLIAAVPGMVDFASIARTRRHVAGWVHSVGNVVVLLLALANLVLRWTAPPTAVIWTGLILSLLTTALLIVTGWVGGELVYRYRISVMEATPEEARKVKAEDRETQRPRRAA